MKKIISYLIGILLVLIPVSAGSLDFITKYNIGFSTYNSEGITTEGNVYYVIDDATDKINIYGLDFIGWYGVFFGGDLLSDYIDTIFSNPGIHMYCFLSFLSR